MRSNAAWWIAVGFWWLSHGVVWAHNAPLDAYGCHETESTADKKTRECHTDLLAGQTFRNLTEEMAAYITAQRASLSELKAQLVALTAQMATLQADNDALKADALTLRRMVASLEAELATYKDPVPTVVLGGVTANDTLTCGTDQQRMLTATVTNTATAEFTNNGQVMVTDLDAPFTMTWLLDCRWTPPGPYQIGATAISASGKRTAHVVPVVVIAAPPPPVSWASGAGLSWEWGPTSERPAPATSFQIFCGPPGTPATYTVTDPTRRIVPWRELFPVRPVGLQTCMMTTRATSAIGTSNPDGSSGPSETVTFTLEP